jgi:DNA modification methylase
VFQQSISKVQGSIQLIQGNCLEELPKIRAQHDKLIIVTDPPFNVGYHYNTYKDSMDDDDYYIMLGDVFQFAPFVVIHYPEEIYKIAFQVGEFPDKVVSWVYNSNTAKQHRDIAFFGVKPDFTKYGQPYKNPTDKRIMQRIADGKSARLYDWWEINQVKNVSKDKTAHPCQMPVEVMKRVIAILPDDYTIVDPFMGSGTTGVACKMLGRNFIGIDMDSTYVEIAHKRISDVIHSPHNETLYQPMLGDA